MCFLSDMFFFISILEFAKFVEKNMNHQFSKFREPFLRFVGIFLRRLEETYLSVSLTKLPDRNSMVVLMRHLFAFLSAILHQCVPSSSYARFVFVNLIKDAKYCHFQSINRSMPQNQIFGLNFGHPPPIIESRKLDPVAFNQSINQSMLRKSDFWSKLRPPTAYNWVAETGSSSFQSINQSINAAKSDFWSKLRPPTAYNWVVETGSSSFQSINQSINAAKIRFLV